MAQNRAEEEEGTTTFRPAMVLGSQDSKDTSIVMDHVEP